MMLNIERSLQSVKIFIFLNIANLFLNATVSLKSHFLMYFLREQLRTIKPWLAQQK